MNSAKNLLPAFMLLAIADFAFGQSGLFHRAENQVEVALVQVTRTSQYTEVQLQALNNLNEVCWERSGPNSPYLISDSRRYGLVGGDNISDCPTRRSYRDREIMVLRFEPLSPQVRDFSLVEGAGGEEQMLGRGSKTDRFWNFLNVKVN